MQKPDDQLTPPEREKPVDGEIEVIDLTGEDLELGPWVTREPVVGEGPPRKIEDTRARLAFVLVGLLAIVLISLLLLLGFGKLPAASIADVAGVLVSPLVGLVGAVTGYYYGRSER